MKLFKERLQHLIDVKKIEQKDVVEGAGVDKAQVSNWLTGKVTGPRRATIYKLAYFFECNIDWLATGKGVPFPSNQDSYYGDSEPEKITTTKEEEITQVRMYRKLAQMDEDTLGEIQTWLNDMERLRPGFKGWFRLEFQNRFPEFDEWKEKITKNQKTGTSD